MLKSLKEYISYKDLDLISNYKINQNKNNQREFFLKTSWYKDKNQISNTKATMLKKDIPISFTETKSSTIIEGNNK